VFGHGIVVYEIEVDRITKSAIAEACYRTA
jgi:hypothetical protein